jgi:hypothetical protein
VKQKSGENFRGNLTDVSFKEKHQSEVNIINDSQFQEAEKFVKKLLSARTVYRTFNEPVGNVRINQNQAYSIRGYFIPAPGPGYQFMTYNPIKQIYEISSVSTCKRESF